MKAKIGRRRSAQPPASPACRWQVSAATSAGTPTAQDFSRCAGCHSTQAGQNKIGPSLAGVFGRTSASVPGYSYSAALKNAHLTWDEQKRLRGSGRRLISGQPPNQQCASRLV
jgi:cytochrome c2